LGEIIPHTPGIAMDASVVFRSLIRALRARCRSSSPKRAGGTHRGTHPRAFHIWKQRAHGICIS